MAFATIKRFPILMGFPLQARANRSSQLPANSSTCPPNCSSSAREAFRELHTISNCRRLRPGLRTITSWPRACAWRRSSCACTQLGCADFRQRNIEKTTSDKVPVHECASRTCLEVFFESDHGSLLQKCEIRDNSPPPKFGCLTAPPRHYEL